MAGKKNGSAKNETSKKESAKKGLGCLPRLIILIVFLIVAVYVAGKVFFPAERVRAEIVKKASQTLGRVVELDNLSFSILPSPSLDLKGLRIYNPEDFPGAEFVTVDRLACDLKLMPLLKKQLVFSEIRVVHPIIRLRKTADGRTNYSFELDTGDKPIETPMGEKESMTSEEAALGVFAFDWAAIEGGDVIYVDDSAQTKTVLSGFDLETRLKVDNEGKTGHTVGTLKIPSMSSTFLPENIPLAIDMAYNADIDFQYADLVFKNTTLEINGIAFGIEATIRNIMDPASVFAKLNARDVSVEPLLDYIPQSEGLDKNLLRLQGKLDADIEARVEMDDAREPYLSGRLDLKDLTVGYQTVAARAHFDHFKIDFDFDSAVFVSQGGRLSDRDFSISGKVGNFDDPVFAVATSGSYELSGLEPFMDAAYGHELSGMAEFDLKAAGQKSKWPDTRFLGTLAVKDGYYNNDSLTSALEKLDMRITLEESRVEVNNLYVEYPGVRATITGTLKNGFAHLLEPRAGHPKPYLDFRLVSPLVNYDILVPEEEEAEVETGSGGDGAEMAAPVFLPDIDAGGTVLIDTLVYSKVEFTNVTGDVAYKDGVITFTDARANLYTGKVSGRGAVDINDMYRPEVNCEFQADDIEANDFMARFANLDGHLYGKMDMKGNLTGQGAEFDEFLRSMVADGDLRMEQGKLVNFDLINNMADQFGFKTFEEESLRDLSGDVRIEDGKLMIDGARVFSKMGDWDIGGGVAFLDKKLDLDIGLYLSEEYSKDLDLLGGLLQDDKGRVKLNFDLVGSYTRPSITNISTSNDLIKEKAEDQLKEGAKNLLDKLFKKN